MTIPTNLFIIFNILVAAILLFTFIKGLINGFAFELIDICFMAISLIAAWFLSPILSNKITIFKFHLDNELVNKVIESTNITSLVNNVIWFIIIVIALNLLFILIKPLFKSLSKVPVLGFVNRLFGGLLGLVKGVFITLLISCLLSTPIFKNGNEIKQNTVLKYLDQLSSLASSYIVNNINFDDLKEEIDGLDVDKARQEVLDWLIDQGILNE